MESVVIDNQPLQDRSQNSRTNEGARKRQRDAGYMAAANSVNDAYNVRDQTLLLPLGKIEPF